MKMNLGNGFLILYDWLPMLEDLSAEGLKELLFALIDRQRNGASEPQFTNPRSELYFHVIQPTIERRLAGQKGGQKTHENGDVVDARVGTRVVATEASKAEQSKEKQSIAIAKRSAEEVCVRDEREKATAAEAAPTAAPSPPPSPTVLSEEEKENLISWGIPENYIRHRLSRAATYADEQGRSVAVVLLDWWDQDRRRNPRSRPPAQTPKPTAPTPSGIDFSCNSFDTDDFFQAALKKSMMSP